MKPTRTSLNLIVLLSIATLAVLMLSQRKPAAPMISKEPAYLANPTETESAEVSAKSSAAANDSAGLPAIVPSAAPVATSVAPSADVSGSNVVDEVEIAYQLGEDISTMTPEARARLMADWQAHRQETQDEAAALP